MSGTLAEELAAAGLLCGGAPILVSLPSYFAIGWTQQFLSRTKALRSDVKIVVGGRWVVGHDGLWIRNKLPEIDLVVYGTAEERALSLLDIRLWAAIAIPTAALFQVLPNAGTSTSTYGMNSLTISWSFTPA